MKRVEERHRRRHPGHQFIHLCNTTEQQEIFVEAGLEAVLSNHNARIDERIFRLLPEAEKRFDAVYDARLTPYKRHDLAVEVESLALLYAFYTGLEDEAHAERTKRLLAHAHRFNETPDGEYTTLAPEEVNGCLNECRWASAFQRSRERCTRASSTCSPASPSSRPRAVAAATSSSTRKPP